MLTAVVVAAIVAFVSPIIGALAAPYIADMNRKRAFRRLMSEPLYEPGAHRVNVYTVNHPDPVCRDAYIETLDVGRVVFRFKRGSQTWRTVFTGQEVENLIIEVME